MLTSVTVDIHPNGDPRVLLDRRDVLLALFDGTGSWANGAEGATSVKEQVVRLLADDAGPLRRAGRFDTELLRRELLQIEAALRRERTSEDSDVAFDFLMAISREKTCELLALGSYGCRLIRDGQEFPIIEARMLVDQAVAEGRLSLSDAVTFPHPEVCVGPYFGDSRVATEGDRLPVIELALLPGDRMLVAREHVLRLAAGRGSLASVRTASELHNLAARLRGVAAVIHFADDPAMVG